MYTTTKMNPRILDSAPTDCLLGIISFLPLKDCLSFGSTSSQNLIHIQPELRLKRKRFRKVFCYAQLSKNPRACKPIRLDKITQITEHHGTYLLPTVLDRVDALHKVLPTSHPLASSVDDLRRAILQIHVGDKDIIDGKDPEDRRSVANFASILNTHKNLVLPFKLHAHILRRSVLSNPEHYEPHYRHGITSGSKSDNGGNILTVTLDRYIGDVLCAFYLMGHSAAEIIEGGLTERDWIEAIKTELPCLRNKIGRDEFEMDTPIGLSATTWYKCWIFVHSSLLRIGHFTARQQLILGIASPTLQSAISDPARGLLLRPHAPFVGCEKTELMRKLSCITNFGALRVTFNVFGPLGPSFRGRDLLQSHTIYPASAMGVIIHFDGLIRSEYEDYIQHPVTTHVPFLRNWNAGQDAVLQSLLEVHEESTKSRPMTVAPPLVTIQCRND